MCMFKAPKAPPPPPPPGPGPYRPFREGLLNRPPAPSVVVTDTGNFTLADVIAMNAAFHSPDSCDAGGGDASTGGEF